MPPRVAILMRSKNEMPHLRAALDMVRKQRFRTYDLFVVDSGSTDGSLDELRAQDLDLHEIPPNEYVPGKVLNDAIARIDHALVVLLNADAIPQSAEWLETLLAPLLEDQADATFSRQVARPDARLIVAYDYARAYDPAKVEAPFFSAVSCAFRRELWERHPFREQGYAEDAAWARTCSETGARLRLVANSVVEHSHRYTLKELFRKHYRQALTFAEMGAFRPNLGLQTYTCIREILRDSLYTCRRLQLHTLPYNMAYRLAIHAGLYKGLRDGRRQGDGR